MFLDFFNVYASYTCIQDRKNNAKAEMSSATKITTRVYDSNANKLVRVGMPGFPAGTTETYVDENK